MKNMFVYGTLRKGEGNAHYLKEATRLAEQCWTNGELYDTGYGYPAMKHSRSSRMYGELYDVNDLELNQIDQLEGFCEGRTNNLYERVEQMVYTDKGPVTAYVYIAGQANLLNNRISDGDWMEYRLLKKQRGAVLYFAYGSCMDHKRFIRHGVDHYFQNMVGVGILDNYSILFTRKSKMDGMGRADIVEEGGQEKVRSMKSHLKP